MKISNLNSQFSLDDPALSPQITEQKFKITAIKPAVKNQHRVNIFIDQKFSFSLDLGQLSDAHLKIGQILDLEQIKQLKSLSNFGKLYQRALEYLASRPHSTKEIQDYLRRKQNKRLTESKLYEAKSRFSSQTTVYQKPKKLAPPISDQDIKQIIAKLTEYKYLDDANFAKYYVENRFQKKGISQRRLRLELTKKGIAPNIIDQVLFDSDCSRSDSDEIKKVITKKRRLGYDDQKLIQYLVRQGFDYELAKDSVSKLSSDLETD